MTKNELNEMQAYLQMYDKGMLSKRTILERIGIDVNEEKERLAIEAAEISAGQYLDVTTATEYTGVGNTGVGNPVVGNPVVGNPVDDDIEYENDKEPITTEEPINSRFDILDIEEE